MNFVDAISLIRNRRASTLSAEELTALREFIQGNPSFYAMAGGGEVVEQYLAEAQAAINEARPAKKDSVAADPVAQIASASTAVPAKSSSGHWGLVAAGVLLLLGIALGIWRWTSPKPPALVDQRKKPAAQNEQEKANKPATPDAPKQQQDGGPEKKKDEQGKSKDKPADASQEPPVDKESIGSTPGAAKPGNAPAEVWDGWLLEHDKSVRIDNQFRWDLTDPGQPRPQKLLTTSGGKIELSGDATVGQNNWLRIVLAELSTGSQGQIEVRVDGRSIARFTVRKADSFAVPLQAFSGKKVRLSVVYVPGQPGDSVVWDTVQLVAHPAGIAWTALSPERLEASSGAKLTTRLDQSIVVEGNSAESDEYLVIATLPHINITAVKLEALSDPALPMGGPGRASNGGFCVGQFAASLTDQDEQRDKIVGRYVRVELPGPDRPLMMAEVEVYAEGKNVALGKQTAQSSAERRSFGERAVDGNRNGVYDHYRPTTVMHTRPGLPDAWWEVDLGREYPIERIAIWNRTDRASEVLANHRVVVLDMYRKVAWQQINPYAPMPTVSYGPFVTSRMPLEFRTASIRTRSMLVEQPQIVRAAADTPTAFATNEASNYLFPLDRRDEKLGKANFAGRQVSFRIRHLDVPQKDPQDPQAAAKVTGHQNLGRFRLLVTADPVPASPEAPVQLVELLPDAQKNGGIVQNKAVTPINGGLTPPARQTKTDLRAANELAGELTWEGWLVQKQAGSLVTPRYLWDVKFTESPQLESRLSTSTVGPADALKGAQLVQTKQIDAASAWLKFRAGQAEPMTPVGQIEVRADGRPIARFEATPIDVAPERLVSLADFVGRNVKLELVHVPGSATEVIDWDKFAFVQNPEAAGYIDWQPLVPLTASGRLDASYKILPDRSVLAGGENPPGDVSTITARMPQQKVTALRLEVLPDPSLPMNGPGRGDRGGWNVGKFAAEVIDEQRPKQTHTGRIVRFETVGKDRGYHLAEVQVFAGGKNVALNKPARQCSETAPGIAARAVDGLPDDQGHGGAAGFAYPGACSECWWEVDLQQDFPIERICIWNRQWSGREMANHKISILDKDRKEVWSFTNPDFPVPCEIYEFPYAPVRPRFVAADETFDWRGAAAPDPLKIIYLTEQEGVPSWHSGDNPGRMQVATFTLDPNENLSGKLVALSIGQFRPLYYNVGRFRYSVTTAPGPHKARMPIVIVPRL